MKPHKKSAGAGRKSDDGNVVLDLGEKHSQKISKMIDAKFAQAGLAGSQKTEIGRPSGSKFTGGRFLGRPALGAGYRPWYAGRRPWMGNDTLTLTASGPRSMFGSLANIRHVATVELLTGVGLGLVGNRALMRLTPALWPTNTNAMVHELIAFGAGLIPLLFKRNATTVGVALPGAVYLGGMLVDKLFSVLGMPSGLPGLAGAVNRPVAQGAAADARQKLAAIQQRIQNGGAQQRNVPRVVAQPQYA